MNLVFKPCIDDDSNSESYHDNDNQNRPLINPGCLYFSEPVQNALMPDSYFIRIIYSDKLLDNNMLLHLNG